MGRWTLSVVASVWRLRRGRKIVCTTAIFRAHRRRGLLRGQSLWSTAPPLELTFPQPFVAPLVLMMRACYTWDYSYALTFM
jgi:hypothetical protein